MKDNQINQAIAEACGWTDVHFSLAATDEFPTERRVVGIPPKHCTHDVAPNYCADLNAMHDAEKFLRDANLLFEYGMHITNSHHYEYLLRATARERAEAFLRTLGKWEEVTK